jgi:hypothetical protein
MARSTYGLFIADGRVSCISVIIETATNIQQLPAAAVIRPFHY